MTKSESWWTTIRRVLKSLATVLSALAVLMTTIDPAVDPVLHYLASLNDAQTTIALSECAPPGGHKLVSLPDGSTVDLNTDSHLSAVMSAKERSLRLEPGGEALFTVVADRKRPFTVKVGHVQIRVLGTRFDVYSSEIYPSTGERITRIAVLEGAIQVTRDDTSSLSIIPLAAGEQIEMPDDRTKVAQLRHLTDSGAERLIAWQHGLIEFEDRPLKEVLAEYARYRPLQVESEDPEILNKRFTGVYQTDDVATLLKALEIQCIHASYKNGDQHIVLSRIHGKRKGDACH